MDQEPRSSPRRSSLCLAAPLSWLICSFCRISKHALPQARSFGSVSCLRNLVVKCPSDHPQSGLNQQSRNSATLGNKVSVTQSTHTVTSRRPHSNSKAGGLEEAAVNLSDEDDSTEREAISKSPPKGMKRLSSEVRICFNMAYHLLIHIVGHCQGQKASIKDSDSIEESYPRSRNLGSVVTIYRTEPFPLLLL